MKKTPSKFKTTGIKATVGRKSGNRSLAEQLNDQQLVALSAACQRDDSTIAIPDKLEDEAISAFATNLTDLGLAEEAFAERGQPVWRQDERSGQPITLHITDQVLAVLGIEEGDATTPAEDPEVAGQAGEALSAIRACDGGRDVTGPPKAAGRGRKATAAVFGPSAAPAQPRRTEPPQPRSGSKHVHLIAMLSSEDGANITEIATALGWLPHTTRAALTGLRHKGYELGREVSGERGSVYRIAAVPITAPADTKVVQAEAV